MNQASTNFEEAVTNNTESIKVQPAGFFIRLAAYLVDYLIAGGIIAMIKALPVEEGVSENLLVHLMSAAIGIFAIVSLSLMLSLGGLLYASMNYLARM